MPQVKFDFGRFFSDSLKILLRPSDYFSEMKKEGGFLEPLIRALLYGVITAAINFFAGNLYPSTMSLIFGTLTGSNPWIFTFIATIIVHVIGLFIMGILILLISAICGGNTDYEASVRVSASLMVMQPVKALLGVSSGMSLSFNMFIVTGLTSIYTLYLLYTALIHALGGKKGTVGIISIFLLSIPVLVMIGSFMCAGVVNNISRDADRIIKQLPEADREMRENIDRLKKMMEDMKRKDKLQRE